MKNFHAWLEDFASTFKGVKDQWLTIDANTIDNDPTIAQELFGLIDQAYKPIGGHVDFRSTEDVIHAFKTHEISVIQAIDVNADNKDDPDAINIYKMRAGGEKGVGSAAKPTSSTAKAKLVQKKVEDFKSHGKYGEVSGAMAKVLLDAGVPVVTDEMKVRSVLGKQIIWMGEHPDLATLKPSVAQVFGQYNGWYARSLGQGETHIKIMVGLPVHA